MYSHSTSVVEQNVGKNSNIRQVNAVANCIALGKTEGFEICRIESLAQYVTYAGYKIGIYDLERILKTDVEEIKQGLN